jgi:hypothetical protein
MELFVFKKDLKDRYMKIEEQLLKKRICAKKEHFKSARFIEKIRLALPWKDKPNLFAIENDDAARQYIVPYIALVEDYFKSRSNIEIAESFFDYYSVMDSLASRPSLGAGNLTADFFMSSVMKKNKLLRKLIRLIDCAFYNHCNLSKKFINISFDKSIVYAFRSMKSNSISGVISKLQPVQNVKQMNILFSDVVRLVGIVLYHLLENSSDRYIEYSSLKSDLSMISAKILTEAKYSFIESLIALNKETIKSKISQTNLLPLKTTLRKLKDRIISDIGPTEDNPESKANCMQQSLSVLIKHLRTESKHPIAKLMNFFLYFDHILYEKNGCIPHKEWDTISLEIVVNNISPRVLACELLLSEFPFMLNIDRFAEFDFILKTHLDSQSLPNSSLINGCSSQSIVSYVTLQSGVTP